VTSKEGKRAKMVAAGEATGTLLTATPSWYYGARSSRAAIPRSGPEGLSLADAPVTTIYTIGHSNQTEAEFLTLLGQHGIKMVIDVRSAPYSRFSPHFNRDNVRPFLREAGIQYTFAGEKLGGRPNDPTCYVHHRIPEPGANYLAEVDYLAVEERPWYQEGIARLLELAAKQRVAIMCSEENPDSCHRHHLIARTLLNRSVKVLHIRQDGVAAPATIALQQTALGLVTE
jgi:uncharacterized protein (DUF488 family)